MSDNSSIEWTSTTWNVVTGCTRVSEGCDNCYIERTMPFRAAHRRFDHDGIGGTTGVLLHPERQEKPLHWRKPRKVFVNSLADLFHDDVPDGFIARVWEIMAATPQHTYQILSKRPARMRSLLSSDNWLDMFERGDAPYPLPNVHLGVSAENQKWADIRVPLLLATPAAVRWVSAEPLLGPIDFGAWLGPVDWPACWEEHSPGDECSRCIQPEWIVVGGESGPRARPMEAAWAQRIVDDCRAAGTKVFVKQLGTVLGGKAHHDIATFPAGLQYREYPTAVPA